MSQARIAPSERLAKAAEDLVSKVDRESNGSSLLGELAQLGARKLIQETLEAEQSEYLARERYERRDADAPRLYRNGYEPGAAADRRGLVEMYARGLSTRDIEDLFRGPDGQVLLSKSAVSGITDRLWEEYEAFSQRDLSDLPLVYLVVDGVYEAMRRLSHVRDGLLVAWGILENGRRVLIHLELGNRESYESGLWEAGGATMPFRLWRAVDTTGSPG